MLLQKRMDFDPGIESQHLANGGFRQPLGTVTLKRQRLKRHARGVLAFGSDLPRKLVRNVQGDFHVTRIAHVAGTRGTSL